MDDPADEFQGADDVAFDSSGNVLLAGVYWGAISFGGPDVLRAFVLWRKRSFGTQSHPGNLFAERLMTIAATARKQNQDVLAFLTACCEAAADEGPVPSLFEAESA